MWRSFILILVLFLPFTITLNCAGQKPRKLNDALLAKSALHALVRDRVINGFLERTDGFTYAVDVGLLMIVAAEERDFEMYSVLREFATAHLVFDSVEDSYTRGFVLWRYHSDVSPDATGTTEALRISEGLWRGANVFGNFNDRELAIRILEGYVRHETEEQGVWFIRNYFNFGTRAFATNSFLVDYAPDFIAEVATVTGREDLMIVADQSYSLIEAAKTPTGLLYDMVQPEVATLFDDRRMIIFSPNDAIQLSNSAVVALCAVVGLPNVASELVSFAHQRMPMLRGTYYGRTGEVARDKRPGIEAWGSLVRLAVALGDNESLLSFYPFLISNARRVSQIPEEAFLYVAAELLLGLQSVSPSE